MKESDAPHLRATPDYFAESEVVARVVSQMAHDVSRDTVPTHVFPLEMLEAARIILEFLEGDDDPAWRERELANIFRELAQRLQTAR